MAIKKFIDPLAQTYMKRALKSPLSKAILRPKPLVTDEQKAQNAIDQKPYVPKALPTAVPKTEGAIPQTKYDTKTGQVTEIMPNGQTAVYTKEQWDAKVGQQIADSSAAHFKPTADQAIAQTISNEISARVKEAVKAGSKPDYMKIFQDMANDVIIQEQIKQIGSKFEAEAAKPVEAYKETQAAPGQEAAFMLTGAAYGAGLGGIAGSVFGGGGTASKAASPIGGIMGAYHGWRASRMSVREFNIAHVTEDSVKAIGNQKKIIKAANTGAVDKLQLIEDWYIEERIILSAETYIQKKGIEDTNWYKLEGAKALADIDAWRRNRENTAAEFRKALESQTPGAIDTSWLNEYAGEAQ